MNHNDKHRPIILPSGTELRFFRDDLNHPQVSGNKLHKLKPALTAATEQGYDTLLSFGGPYSNHLHALAWACKEHQLNSIGLVRGELLAKLTPTLEDCQQWGMRLIPITRVGYRSLVDKVHIAPQPLLSQNLFRDELASIHIPNKALVIPEGGSSKAAVQALSEAYSPIFKQPEFIGTTHVFCATGTGATLAGLYKAAPKSANVFGVQAVAEGDATMNRINAWLENNTANLNIIAGHLGGFAKMPNELNDFINHFEQEHQIPLDAVYNGKVVYHVYKMVDEGFFPPNSKVLIIHTGGLQGKRSKAL